MSHVLTHRIKLESTHRRRMFTNEGQGESNDVFCQILERISWPSHREVFFKEEFIAMDMKSATVWIGGAAGDGVASTGDILAKTCSRSGLHYFAQSSYQSVIRGGHVVYQFQASSEPVYTHGDNFDLLIALNQDSVDYHIKSINKGAGRGFIFNSDKVKLDVSSLPAGAVAYGLPVGDLTAEFGRNPVMQNTLACGVFVYLLQLSWDVFEKAVRDQFGKKKAEIADLNVKVARKGFEYAQSKFQPLKDIVLKGDGKSPHAVGRQPGHCVRRRGGGMHLLFRLSHDPGVGHHALAGAPFLQVRYCHETVRRRNRFY
jgi:Pyruvate/2-oxoacid:ferredoxin oxidoreductase gamma subunit